MVNQYVGVRVPPAIYEQMVKDVEKGEYNSVSDWVREACRKFYLERRGGGALAKGSKRRGRRATAQAPPIVSRQ